MRMNRKVSTNKRHKYSDEERLAHGEDKNISSLINTAQEDDSNIFESKKKHFCYKTCE